MFGGHLDHLSAWRHAQSLRHVNAAMHRSACVRMQQWRYALQQNEQEEEESSDEHGSVAKVTGIGWLERVLLDWFQIKPGLKSHLRRSERPWHASGTAGTEPEDFPMPPLCIAYHSS